MNENLNDALIEVVKAGGGSKLVGAQMRPELLVDDAGKWLRDCLNPDRREKLSTEQIFWLLRLGHDIGCHAAMEFIGMEVGYTVAPIEKKDMEAALQREFIESVKGLNKLSAKLEARGLLKAVA